MSTMWLSGEQSNKQTHDCICLNSIILAVSLLLEEDGPVFFTPPVDRETMVTRDEVSCCFKWRRMGLFTCSSPV